MKKFQQLNSYSLVKTQQYLNQILWAIVLLIVPTSVIFGQLESVSFYVVAHQDDWQLFMAKSAQTDVLNSKNKTVFITLTAGDAGLGNGSSALIPYFQARENGSKLSAKFLADILTQADKSELNTFIYANSHKIACYKYKNTVNYFLRLPDGNASGDGYPKTGNQSLKRLKDKTVPSVMAVDSSTTYQGWDDLVATVRRLIVADAAGFNTATINLPETDTKFNPGDHIDHQYAGKLAEDASKDLTCLKKNSWIGYPTAGKAVNVTNDELMNSVAAFACNAVGNIQGGYKSNWDAAHKQWIGKNTSRVTDIRTIECTGVTPNVSIQSDKPLVLRNKATGKVFEIAGASTGAGAFLQLGTRASAATHQQFIFKKTPENLWVITGQQSELALDAYGGGSTPGTRIWQFRVNGTNAQNWLLEAAGDSSFFIKNQKSGLYIEGGLAAKSNEVTLQNYIGDDKQKWQIVSAEKAFTTNPNGEITTAVKEIVEEKSIWKVFPNPLQYADQVNFSLDKGKTGDVTVTLSTMGGQLLSSQTYQALAAGSTQQFDFPPITHGIYILEFVLQTDGQPERKAFQIVR
jgi:hypothetical protein